MALIYESAVPDPDGVYVCGSRPQQVVWQEQPALRLSGEPGASLLVVPDLSLERGRVEVDIGADSAAYAGIAFRIRDSFNYELAYAQPHTSGQWDALQYDPIFHGSNTWQLYHGPGAQLAADCPPQSWFRLQVAFREDRAVVRVGEQAPLWVPRLAHGRGAGMVGLWTYLPAHFANLCIWDDVPRAWGEPDFGSAVFPALPDPAEGAVTSWLLEGFGRVEAEPGGILNLHRYLPSSVQEARLVREIEVPEDGVLTFKVGFSDELTLQVDDDVVFSGENRYHCGPVWAERGYVTPDQEVVCTLSKGRHSVVATVCVKELFGWGLAVVIEGVRRLLPVM